MQGEADAAALGAARTLLTDVIAVQRAVLLDLRASGKIGSTALRAIERDLDLEEARIG
jgi:hypothetical protein